MRKLLNDPRNVVREMLEGMADLTPGLALLDTENVAVRADLAGLEERPVAVISGGGAGHEPAHAGYVGAGMLSAAVTGDVFTSPSADAVLAAIHATAGPKGALLIIKNYTGDRLNFGLAAELAKSDGIPVEIVVVADDVALAGIVPPERRRGIAGTVLIHKIAGAAAAAGLPLDEVARKARDAASRVGTMGVALGSCTVPAAGKPGFTLGDDEIELGLGIHGEKGVEREAIAPADALVDRLVARIVEDRGLASGDRVALLVNGLGATPPMELAIVARRALARLRSRGLVVERAWSGNFLTALEMPGCSLSVLKLAAGDLEALDAATAAAAWPGGGRLPERRQVVAVPSVESTPENRGPTGEAATVRHRAFGVAVAAALKDAEAHLTDLDSRAGDGDLGASMVRGAEAVLSVPRADWAVPASALLALSGLLRKTIAGSSGPFYAVALARAARRLGRADVGAEDVIDAFDLAIAAVRELGGAKPGDRTMVDALQPALDALRSSGGEPTAVRWKRAAESARRGAEATASMSPKLGRASYLGERAVGIPDGGAVAVAVWLEALAGAVAKEQLSRT